MNNFSNEPQISKIPAKSQNIELTPKEKILIERAMSLSPTGGNSKPFIWEWKNKSLIIYHDESLDKHYLNRNKHTSLLALGCLLTSVEVAASFLNLHSTCKVNETTLTSQIDFEKLLVNSSKVESLKALFPFLELRSTYRGQFQADPRPLLHEKFHIVEKQSSTTSVELKKHDQMLPSFLHYFIKAESYLWYQKMATKDFIREVRFFSKKNNKTVRGISSYELGISLADQTLLFLLKNLPSVLSFIRKIPLLNFSFVKSSKQTFKNANFFLVRSNLETNSSLIDAGKLAMQTWLELESKGYKAQPLSFSSIPVLDACTQSLPKDTLESFKIFYEEQAPKELDKNFLFHKSLTPVWILRFGKPK
ncbi:MAG: hypothetical protein L6Q37_11245 [Bdellovibrionaceae bacterium]|nr:hypothetical protein [Pseudobdellovibrionaceae bacterium]NUM57310.1 hypothetical protein [Pseudobdellovibrionaceae bacterium]